MTRGLIILVLFVLLVLLVEAVLLSDCGDRCLTSTYFMMR